jgi:hypothetical protein
MELEIVFSEGYGLEERNAGRSSRTEVDVEIEKGQGRGKTR